MKNIILADPHGRDLWKKVVEQEGTKDTQYIFLGDYFDSFDISGIDQMQNFKDIIEFKETSQCQVIMLVGNHDYHYIPEIGYTGTSGFQRNIAPSITQLVDENREHLQMSFQIDDVLFTHAGVSSMFMEGVFGADWSHENIPELLNEQFKYKPKTFCFTGRDPYGDDLYQTPIWIRPGSLVSVNKKTLEDKIIQVVGHTHQKHIPEKGYKNEGRYYFVDTFDNVNPEYLIYEDGKFTVNYIK
jgi:Calcineurin-like phosphoesterase